MDTIEWTAVDYCCGRFETVSAQTRERWDAEDFLSVRSAWGDAPHADLLESLGVVGYLWRGAGNDDPYLYLLRPDEYESEYEIALVDSRGLENWDKR